MSAAYELQTAVKTAMEGAAPLDGWPVFDGPPATAAPPYITFGPEIVTEAGGKAAPMRRHRFAVTLWVDGSAASALKPAMAAVESAIVAMDAALEGGRLVRLNFLRSFTKRELRDGMSRGEVEFEAVIETA